MRNHFDLLIRSRADDHCGKLPRLSQHFASFFASYAKSFKTMYRRIGSLFEHPFHRVEVTSDAYFCQLVVYIHRNPQHHGFVHDFRQWPFSSYRAVLSTKPTRVQRAAVLEWFGGRTRFVDAHRSEVDESQLRKFLLEVRFLRIYGDFCQVGGVRAGWGIAYVWGALHRPFGVGRWWGDPKGLLRLLVGWGL